MSKQREGLMEEALYWAVETLSERPKPDLGERDDSAVILESILQTGAFHPTRAVPSASAE